MQNAPNLQTMLTRLKRPLRLTWAGLIAERLVQAFWPLWSVGAAASGALMLGLQDSVAVEIVWGGIVVAAIAAVAALCKRSERYVFGRESQVFSLCILSNGT